MMMNLMRSGLENIVKSKVMRKTKQLTSKKIEKRKVERKNSVPGSLQHL